MNDNDLCLRIMLRGDTGCEFMAKDVRIEGSAISLDALGRALIMKAADPKHVIITVVGHPTKSEHPIDSHCISIEVVKP
jgi:hypothetical protein